MKYIGNKEKLRRSRQKIIHLKKELKEKKKELDKIYNILEYWPDLRASIKAAISMNEDLVKMGAKDSLKIRKQNRIIDLMAEEIHSIVNLGEFIDRKIDKLDTKQEIIDYFTKKAEEQ